MDLPYWPISGPTFLVVYAIAFAAVVAGVVASRRADDREAPDVDPSELDCYDAALLHGGEELAVTVALVNLRSSRASEGHNGQLQRHPVERSLAKLGLADPCASVDGLRDSARSDQSIRTAIGRLETLGLLRPAEEQSRLALQALWFLPLMFFGVIRLVVGISRGRPVLFLVGLLVATVVAMIMTARRVRTTPEGKAMLQRLRAASPLPSDRTAIPPAAIGAAVALFGASLLWSAEPSLAAALSVPRPSSRGGGDSGGCGAGDGGGGGCGGCGGCGG